MTSSFAALISRLWTRAIARERGVARSGPREPQKPAQNVGSRESTERGSMTELDDAKVTHAISDDSPVCPDLPRPDEPPPRTRREPVVEAIHGVLVDDPYRWLEGDHDPEVADWVEAQGAYASEQLQALPAREPLARRFIELLDLDEISAPERRGNMYFYSRRPKGAQKLIYCFRRGQSGPEELLLDPYRLASDGSATVHGVFPAPDGRLVAYKVSRNNTDDATLHILDLETGHALTDVIDAARYAAPQWTHDGRGFYYVGLPIDEAISPVELPGRAEVRFHRVGDPAAHDRVVVPATLDASRSVEVSVSHDGHWLFVSHHHGWNSTDVHFLDLRQDDPALRPLVIGRSALYNVVAWRGRFYVHTNEGADRFRAFSVDPHRPDRDAWLELVPESDAVLERLQIVGERLILSYLRDASSVVEIRGLDGRLVRELPLPHLGTVNGLLGAPDDDRAYYGFSSFTEPGQIFEVSVASGVSRLWRRIEAPVDASRFVVERLRYASADSTTISMFVVRRGDLELDGEAPALLIGYGGFAVNMTPRFSAQAVVWVERGGVLAVPNLRGGGEFGEEWHQAGTRERKQNVFDDFAAAARTLVARGYTRHDRLALLGASNGGLLVGATMVHTPELARAAVCAVPLLDMVRYTHFSAGRTWIGEYGDPADPRDFAFLHRYSPYHHIEAGVDYPALLMIAMEGDDRVAPLHARKFTAALQRVSRRPALLRVTSNAGHCGPDHLQQRIDLEVDILAFLLAQLAPV
ncbi:prolyl oligopeptidase family serine peptidase [Nannocystis pusilla]|uniref:prolyl oligopeptidase n=1 Tax=Nannocystis pusilla TaxID=889268 RepID=A0ABS7TKP8_9BACT|nr:prolyl oligopeptidase family serine peptidase [Nannocystis pusilla]MBZ5708801.1 prolyl oligopeptidase family serine peptidase [Nannocystis pusilla]